MAILSFQKPDKIVLQKANDFEGQFEFRPLEPGFGLTLGNALRRVLLSSLEGFAIVGIKIEGVDHEFATLKGVTEDVTEMILNLKQVRFKRKADQDVSSEKITISIKGNSEFNAGNIGDASQQFQVMNPELVICTMDSTAKLEIELTISKGRGYIPSEENKLKEIKETIIYGKPNCPQCAMAKSLLDSRGIEYDYIDITTTGKSAAEITGRAGVRSLPQIYLDGEYIGGFTELNTRLSKTSVESDVLKDNECKACEG